MFTLYSVLFFWMIPAQDVLIFLEYRLGVPSGLAVFIEILLAFVIIYAISYFLSKSPKTSRIFSGFYWFYLVGVAIIFSYPVYVLSISFLSHILFHNDSYPSGFIFQQSLIIPQIILIIYLLYQKMKNKHISIFFFAILCLITAFNNINVLSGSIRPGYASLVYCFQTQDDSQGMCSYLSKEEKEQIERSYVRPCIVDTDQDPLNGCQGY
jgi:hypothetical protein